MRPFLAATQHRKRIAVEINQLLGLISFAVIVVVAIVLVRRSRSLREKEFAAWRESYEASTTEPETSASTVPSPSARCASATRRASRRRWWAGDRPGSGEVSSGFIGGRRGV